MTIGGTMRVPSRHWALKLHKWLGLMLAVPLVVLGLSGAALVWDGALGRLAHPQRYATSGAARLPTGRYAAAVRLAPGERLQQLVLPSGGGPVIATVSGGPAPMLVYLDPPTARVLDRAPAASGAGHWVRAVHASLLLPGGRAIVGALGVALALVAVTGLWLWWPAGGGWRRALRWRRRPDMDANLHQFAGFWATLPLLVLAGTGAGLSFAALPGGATQHPATSKPVAARLPVDVAVARAQAVAAGRLRTLTWPTARKPDWLVELKPAGAPALTVAVADDGAVAVPLAAPWGEVGSARWLRRLHGGHDMGPVWQAMLVTAGLALALLSVTGALMGWRAWRWRHRAPPLQIL